MSFDDDLDAQLAAELPTDDVEVVLKGNLYTLRFTQMDGLEWASACDMFPPRPGVGLDQYYGYYLRPLSLFVASKTGQRVDGDNLTKLTPEQWAILFKALPGRSVSRIGDALFGLNEVQPQRDVDALKKASAAESAKNSKQPKLSASPAEGSSDGNPAKPSDTSSKPE